MKLPKRNTISDSKNININIIEKQKQGYKPIGIWYSCYNSWYNWIIEENMTSFMKKYIYKITINKNVLTNIDNINKNKLLIIKNIKDFDKFNNKYKIIDSTNTFFGGINNNLINWEKVSDDFGGIEICPYIVERKNYLWYNMWDVASGCIWNMPKIINTTEMIYKKKNNIYQKI